MMCIKSGIDVIIEQLPDTCRMMVRLAEPDSWADSKMVWNAERRMRILVAF